MARTSPWARPRTTLGTQAADSLGETLRAAYTFTPELSLQVYSQVFLARVNYGPFFNGITSGQRDRIPPRVLGPPDTPPPATERNPDSLPATLNVNVVLRWEYRLGSTPFVVYTRAQNPALTSSPGGAEFDIRPLLHGRGAEDVAMIKLAYWWG